ncbi:SsrA-binding protein SmpB [Arsenophonus symbiont of Ornithomya chloropus]|uniref:SsrA-binding protein SmpB n=1 Tax=Arsenophonus symbiont of Ornithomya chloropus TaxID=634121 RepID=UPI0032B26FA6
MNKKTKKSNYKIIIINKKAKYEYFIHEVFEAGLNLLGWEVKALRSGNVNINNTYVSVKNKEAYLLGLMITPLRMASSNIIYDSTRTRKLLLNQNEINLLLGKIHKTGHTIIVLSLYWKNAWCKTKIALATGKNKHDKRSDIKKQEWIIQKNKIMKNKNK